MNQFKLSKVEICFYQLKKLKSERDEIDKQIRLRESILEMELVQVEEKVDKWVNSLTGK